MKSNLPRLGMCVRVILTSTLLLYSIGAGIVDKHPHLPLNNLRIRKWCIVLRINYIM